MSSELPAPTPGAVRGAAVEFRTVSARYGGPRGAVAVDRLSLSIQPGEICVLVGPSGCGKTTTLRLVNRLIEPVSGQVLVNGEDVAAADPVALRRRIGYVIQQIGLFPHQTVADNVAAVPRLLRWPPERVRQRVDDLLALTGLDPGSVRHRYPSQLSGGERQRVGVARALAAEPPLLLMDEPFGAVDPIVRARLQDEFLRLQRTLGTTVLFVTHDVDEAIKMGTHVAVMQVGGSLAQYSRPADLLAAPDSEYVAEFVGADRALKRLALFHLVDVLDDVPLELAPTLTDGMLRLDASVNLRDAVAALLTAPQHAGVVVGDDGVPRGTVTLAALLQAVGS